MYDVDIGDKSKYKKKTINIHVDVFRKCKECSTHDDMKIGEFISYILHDEMISRNYKENHKEE